MRVVASRCRIFRAIASLGPAETALARGNLELAQHHAEAGQATLGAIGARQRATQARQLLPEFERPQPHAEALPPHRQTSKASPFALGRLWARACNKIRRPSSLRV